MGNVPGKKYKIILNQDDLQFLVNNTQFNQNEIEEWHARFTVSILKLLYKTFLRTIYFLKERLSDWSIRS